LKSDNSSIERELGYQLDWEELPSRRDCRVCIRLCEVDPEDETDWPKQQQWLATKLNELHRVFATRIADLDADVDREAA
jgi:hypothetical protein